MKNKLWIALGMLAFAVLLCGIYWLWGKYGMTFTEVSG